MARTTLASPPQLDPLPSPDTYRRLALSLPGTTEGSHMGAADFRVNGRIFATLAYGARGWGTLMLPPEQQAQFLADLPELCIPAPGGWGRMGMTLIRVDAPEDVLAGAFHTAHRNQSAKKPVRPRTKPPASATRRTRDAGDARH